MCQFRFGLVSAVAWACLASISNGRRLQLSSKQPQARLLTAGETLEKAISQLHTEANLSNRQEIVNHTVNLLKSLTNSLAARDLPAAFNPSTASGTSSGNTVVGQRIPLAQRLGQGVLMRPEVAISKEGRERLQEVLKRVNFEAPGQNDLVVVLNMLLRVPLDVHEARPKSLNVEFLLRPYKFIDGRLHPSGEATRLSIVECGRSTKRMLKAAWRTGDALQERLEKIIARCSEALKSGRPKSAWTVFDQGKQEMMMGLEVDKTQHIRSRLIGGGLLAAIALRNVTSYEETLQYAQGQMVDLREDGGKLMSEVMVACCANNWLHHASSINSSLVSAGLTPSVDAMNAFMALQLRSDDDEGALDTYLYMKDHGPEPDLESYALAAWACTSFEGKWSDVHNMMQRKMLGIPWNQKSASAAFSAFVKMGSIIYLEEAVRVTNYMDYMETKSCLSSFEALLKFASVYRHCGPMSLAIYEAMQVYAEAAYDAADEEEEEEDMPPMRASSLLFILPHLPNNTERIAFCEDALSRSTDEFGWLEPEDNMKMQAALALLHAANGNGSASAAWLASLHEEGVPLETLDSDGSLAFALNRMQLDAKSPLDDFQEILDESPVDLRTAKLGVRSPKAAKHPGQQNTKSLWLLALQACGENADAAAEILKEMRSRADVMSAEGLGIEALLQYLGVCSRACDVNKSWKGLNEFDGRAPVEAYLSVLMTCCAGTNPDMDLADKVLGLMQRSYSLLRASPSQLLTMYVLLIKGQGQRGDLETARKTFLSACAWLNKTAQKKVRGGWAEREWVFAKRALYRCMVDLAAPTDARGLSLACDLCEKLEREDGIGLDSAYLAQLTGHCESAEEMSFLLNPLLVESENDPNVRHVSLATINALMGAFKKPPIVSVYKLAEAGIRMTGVWADYLRPSPKISILKSYTKKKAQLYEMSGVPDERYMADIDAFVLQEIGDDDPDELDNFDPYDVASEAEINGMQEMDPFDERRARKGKWSKLKRKEMAEQKAREKREQAEQAELEARGK